MKNCNVYVYILRNIGQIFEYLQKATVFVNQPTQMGIGEVLNIFVWVSANNTNSCPMIVPSEITFQLYRNIFTVVCADM